MTVPIPTEFEPSRFFRITTKPKEKALLKKREIFIRKLAAIALPPVGPVALRRLLSRVVPFTWEENHLYTAIKVHLPADFMLYWLIRSSNPRGIFLLLRQLDEEKPITLR